MNEIMNKYKYYIIGILLIIIIVLSVYINHKFAKNIEPHAVDKKFVDNKSVNKSNKEQKLISKSEDNNTFVTIYQENDLQFF